MHPFLLKLCTAIYRICARLFTEAVYCYLPNCCVFLFTNYCALLFSDHSKPAKPIRLMVSLLILKYVRNISDENLVEQWSENIYFQYFSGEQNFRAGIPCVPTELVAFRQRIGETGVELILKESIRVNEPPDDSNTDVIVSVDTTVQEKNITYPTDDKLYKKIIKKCWAIADKEAIDLRQSYTRVVKQLGNLQRFKTTKYGAKAARKANKKIQIIAGRLVRDIARKLPLSRLGQYLPALKLYQRILSQQRGDTDKIYSLHEPNVKCYSKGKEHKKFEFGSKVSILIDQQTGIIMGAVNFTQTLHDSKTLPEVLEQYERIVSFPVSITSSLQKYLPTGGTKELNNTKRRSYRFQGLTKIFPN